MEMEVPERFKGKLYFYILGNNKSDMIANQTPDQNRFRRMLHKDRTHYEPDFLYVCEGISQEGIKYITDRLIFLRAKKRQAKLEKIADEFRQEGLEGLVPISPN